MGMSELKGEGDCPYCGKHFKHLENHKCKAKDDDSKEQSNNNLLIPSDSYLSNGVHIGIKSKSKDMNDFIFKIRPDGLVIFNIQKIDERLRTIIKFLSKFSPDEILIVSKRENGKKPLEMLSHATGIKTIVGRYLPGTMTNPNNDYFIEPKVVIITNTWYDKQALADAVKSGAVIISLCNSNCVRKNIDIILPCNNRGRKSLSLIYWLIAREYAKARGLEFNYSLEKFM